MNKYKINIPDRWVAKMKTNNKCEARSLQGGILDKQEITVGRGILEIIPNHPMEKDGDEVFDMAKKLQSIYDDLTKVLDTTEYLKKAPVPTCSYEEVNEDATKMYKVEYGEVGLWMITGKRLSYTVEPQITMGFRVDEFVTLDSEFMRASLSSIKTYVNKHKGSDLVINYDGNKNALLGFISVMSHMIAKSTDLAKETWGNLVKVDPCKLFKLFTRNAVNEDNISAGVFNTIKIQIINLLKEEFSSNPNFQIITTKFSCRKFKNTYLVPSDTVIFPVNNPDDLIVVELRAPQSGSSCLELFDVKKLPGRSDVNTRRLVNKCMDDIGGIHMSEEMSDSHKSDEEIKISIKPRLTKSYSTGNLKDRLQNPKQTWGERNVREVGSNINKE